MHKINESVIDRRRLARDAGLWMTGLVALGALSTACSSDPHQEQRGQTTTTAAATKPSSTAHMAEDGAAASPQPALAVSTPDAAPPPAASTEPATAPAARLDPAINGAVPQGFFSYGAPTLTRDQIAAGVQIKTACEGSFHQLTIEPEHLVALASGKAVDITCSTNPHFGNPTIHNHVISYIPQLTKV